jgi:hypothetical protein
MDRNRLKGMAADRINAILSAAGMNFIKLLKFLEGFLCLFLISWVYCDQELLDIAPLEIAAYSESTIVCPE